MFPLWLQVLDEALVRQEELQASIEKKKKKKKFVSHLNTTDSAPIIENVCYQILLHVSNNFPLLYHILTEILNSKHLANFILI